jgi:hypothetical protein
MKLLRLLALTVLAAAPVHAGLSPVSVRVDQVSKTESNDKDPKIKTQVRSLRITLENNSNTPAETLQVKYWIISRDMKSDDLEIFDQGEKKASLSPRAKVEMETSPARTTYGDDHFKLVRNTKKGHGQSKNSNPFKVQKVGATGDKITGYAVQVFDGGKLVAEQYSDAGLKDDLGGMTSAHPAPKKK